MIQTCLKRSDGRHPPAERAWACACGWSRAPTRSRSTVAYQQKSEVDAAFVELMRLLLDEGTYPAIATHDPAMIEATKAYAHEQGLRRTTASSSRCCTAFAAICRRRWWREGYRVRVYVPFGKQWYPVLHAPARRAAGQRRVRVEGNPQRSLGRGFDSARFSLRPPASSGTSRVPATTSASRQVSTDCVSTHSSML